MEAGMTPAVIAPTLIALDWGTSSLRAYLMDGEGRIMDRRSNAHGIQNLPVPGVAGFERVFGEICGEWLNRHPGLPVDAGGMVGSARLGRSPLCPLPGRHRDDCRQRRERGERRRRPPADRAGRHLRSA